MPLAAVMTCEVPMFCPAHRSRLLTLSLLLFSLIFATARSSQPSPLRSAETIPRPPLGQRVPEQPLFAGDGAGNFAFVSGTSGLTGSFTFETADMNRDGWDDLVITGRSPSNFSQCVLYVAINSRSANGWSFRQTLLTGTVHAFAIGGVTADGKLDVVLALEECSGCGISGWGWEDDGWGAVNTPGVTLRFPKAERQWLRLQTREDGFSFDQIVLSARKYKTQRPGTAKNDNTILERTQY